MDEGIPYIELLKHFNSCVLLENSLFVPRTGVMATTDIFYFSGTGNSLAVARDVADKLNARLIPVFSMADREWIDTEADNIGFVFPIYDFKSPKAMDACIRKLRNIAQKYLFAICTYGITPSRTLHHFNKVVKSCGGHLSAGFAVSMPHNGIGSGALTAKQRERMFSEWKNRREELVEYITAKKEGRIESSILVFRFFQPGIIRMAPSALKLLMHMVFKGIKSLALVSGNACDGCGICERICPANNIAISGGKPVWSDHCAGCFACFHWCPKETITLGGHTMNIKAYHHPDVKMSDIMRQRQ
jgi:flavodoxin/ferredoxin